MAARNGIFGLLVALFVTSYTGGAFATTTQAPRGGAATQANQWVRTMEASVSGAVRVPDSRRDIAPIAMAPRQGGMMAWLGWIFAAGFLVILTSLHMRVRRRERRLMRGPDLFLLRPAVDRRKRPR